MDSDRFACTVTNEKRIHFMDPAERTRFVEHASTLVGQACELTLEAEPVQASDKQRRWWRGRFIPVVAEEAGYDREERDALHHDLLRECFGTYEKLGLVLPVKASWTQLSVREAWELMEWGVRFAAKTWGVAIRFPSAFASADSTNIGRNIGIDQAWQGPYAPPTKESRVQVMRSRIESQNAPGAYDFMPHQDELEAAYAQ